MNLYKRQNVKSLKEHFFAKFLTYSFKLKTKPSKPLRIMRKSMLLFCMNSWSQSTPSFSYPTSKLSYFYPILLLSYSVYTMIVSNFLWEYLWFKSHLKIKDSVLIMRIFFGKNWTEPNTAIYCIKSTILVGHLNTIHWLFDVEVSSLKSQWKMMLDIEISGLCFELKFDV